MNVYIIIFIINSIFNIKSTNINYFFKERQKNLKLNRLKKHMYNSKCHLFENTIYNYG
jgi:hypothetical protein